jgi:short-subunit dehydrogenase
MTKLEAGQSALVTGSSSGIGRAFARALARRGLHVVLVARDRARLDRLAAEIGAQGSRAEVLVADLGDPVQLARVEDRLRGEPAIDLLVNNAAFGVSGRFTDVSVEAAERQILVNVRAPTRLAHAALEGMLARRRGGLINVSSGTAFVPSLYNAAYSGTKAYLAILSLTMAEELRDSGIHVLTVFPGFTRTEFQQRAGFDVSRVPGYLWQEASQVVDEALAAFDAGRQFCVPGALNKVAIALNHLVPYSSLGRVAGLLARLTPRPRPSENRQ